MKKIITLLIVCTMLMSVSTTAFASSGNWYLDDYGWWYQNEDGSYPFDSWQLIDDNWYHFDDNGYMQTGWILDDYAWYYLYSSGVMATGWILDNYAWYYMNPSGAMATGWLHLGDYWYYLLENGVLVTGEREIDGKINYFDSDGHWIGEEAESYNETVYVTKYGEKFHRATCPTIQNSSNISALSREEAIWYGYEACLVCKP